MMIPSALTFKYIGLIRGVNVGKERRISMSRLKMFFESLGYSNVSTYLNSGNIIFESKEKQNVAHKKVEDGIKKEFGLEVPILIKTVEEIKVIARAIPDAWQNNAEQRSDVAYLFPEIDSNKIIDELPVKKEFMDIRYTKGAVFWNIDRKNYNKSHLNKIIGHELYQHMTIRNVNTARHLADIY